METTSISANLAIPIPPRVFDDRAHRTPHDVLDELCALSGQLELPLFGWGIYRPRVELLEGANRDEPQIEQWFSPKGLEKLMILRLSVEVPLMTAMDIESVGDSRDRSETDVADLAKAFIRDFLSARVCDLVVMANLSHVGSLGLRDCVFVQDGTPYRDSELGEMNTFALRAAIEVSESIGWPKLNTLDFATVWRWAIDHEGCLDSFDGTPMSRALSAFSRLFAMGVGAEPMGLLWALIGIEALYAEGTVALVEQVKEKVQVFLGQQKSFKKRIGQMYDFRSRFVHGDLDFPGFYQWDDVFGPVDRFQEGLFQSTGLAVAILVATLQEIIRRGWAGLSFSYVANDSRRTIG